MLQSIRDNTQGWLTTSVIGLLVIIFALWGIHGYLNLNDEGRNKIVAKVAGQTLSQQEFNTAYQRVYRQTQQHFGTEAALSEGLVKQLKKQTVEQWRLMQVLVQSAYRDNYRLSQSAIDATLLSIPLFQSSGRFSSRRFYSVLDAMAYSQSQFLTDLKQTLLIKQVQQGLTQSAFVLPEELKRTITLIHQKRDFSYLIIPSSQFLAEQNVSVAQALAYYQNNKNYFMHPEQVSIEYIKLSLTGLKDERLFLQKRDELANLSYTHPESLENAAHALGLSIQSTSLFSQRGGSDLLTKNKKVILTAFKKDILQGNNSPVIDLDDNTSIVFRIKQHKLATVPVFSEVKAQILEILQKDLASEQALAVGRKLLRELKEQGSLTQKTSKLNLSWQIIKQADRNDAKVSSEILRAAFSLSLSNHTGKIPRVTGLSLANGDYVLVKLIAVHDGNDQKLSTSQKGLYTKELENKFGQLDYDLYIHGLMQKA
jgi:peptidyl-prolyl cis-trans isomerase D